MSASGVSSVCVVLIAASDVPWFITGPILQRVLAATPRRDRAWRRSEPRLEVVLCNRRTGGEDGGRTHAGQSLERQADIVSAELSQPQTGQLSNSPQGRCCIVAVRYRTRKVLRASSTRSANVASAGLMRPSSRVSALRRTEAKSAP